MAHFALTNQALTFNAVDLSDHVRSSTLSVEAEALDSTTMGDSWRESTGGLKSGTLTIEFLDDFAANEVDATVWSAFNTGTAIAITTKPVNSATGATNPEYQFNILPNQHNLGGSLGEMAGKSLTFPVTGAVTRAVA